MINETLILVLVVFLLLLIVAAVSVLANIEIIFRLKARERYIQTAHFRIPLGLTVGMAAIAKDVSRDRMLRITRAMIEIQYEHYEPIKGIPARWH